MLIDFLDPGDDAVVEAGQYLHVIGDLYVYII